MLSLKDLVILLLAVSNFVSGIRINDLKLEDKKIYTELQYEKEAVDELLLREKIKA